MVELLWLPITSYILSHKTQHILQGSITYSESFVKSEFLASHIMSLFKICDMLSYFPICNVTDVQWGHYIFDPLANYENWLLVAMGAEYKFTHLFM